MFKWWLELKLNSQNTTVVNIERSKKLRFLSWFVTQILWDPSQILPSIKCFFEFSFKWSLFAFIFSSLIILSQKSYDLQSTSTFHDNGSSTIRFNSYRISASFALKASRLDSWRYSNLWVRKSHNSAFGVPAISLRYWIKN